MGIVNTNENVIEVVDVTDSIFANMFEQYDEARELFDLAVFETRIILESDLNPIPRISTSFGKDSFLTMNIVIEALTQSINEGKVPADTPLLISSVDTGMESIPMAMYVRYASKLLNKYCNEHKLNIHFNMVRPQLHEDFFVKYCSANKLISNASRSGDCTDILKVTPATRFLKNTLDTIAKDRHVVTFVGSRTEESSRRSGNMKTQGLIVRDVEAFVNKATSEGTKLHSYAPIRNWTSEDVFSSLDITGCDPMVSYKKPIPSFLSHAGLLIEIYGNGTGAETCEINLTGTEGAKLNKMCGGKSARYGCTLCTQVVSDKSGEAYSKLKRWNILGAEDALRLRDWLLRTSMDGEARAYHARAVDPVFNRIILNPNVLKTRHLIKFYRYACQITSNGLKEAKRFSELVRAGRTEEHEGYAEIQNDMSIHPKAKQMFLEMYEQEAQVSLTEYITLPKAVLMSFRWALEGVGALPYTPYVLYKEILEGKGWIPMPKLNFEMPYAVQLKPTKIEESIPVRMYKEAYEKNGYWQDDLMDLYQPNVHYRELIADMDFNCTAQTEHKNKEAFYVNGTLGVEVYKGACTWALDTDELITVILHPESYKSKTTGKKISVKRLKAVEGEVNEHVTNLVRGLIKQNTKVRSALMAAIAGGDVELDELKALLEELTQLSGRGALVEIRALNHKEFAADVRIEGRKKSLPSQKSERNFKRVGGKIDRRLSKIRFYKPYTESALTQVHGYKGFMLTTDHQLVQDLEVRQYNWAVNDEIVMDNIMFSADTIKERWGDYQEEFEEHVMSDWDIVVNTGGEALGRSNSMAALAFETYYSELETRRKNRTSLYSYDSEKVIHQMMREGGVFINPKYYDQFIFMLKRTGIMAMRGAFDYQNMSREKIMKDPAAMTMVKHRSDKAAYMLRVKKVRSECRKDTRKKLEAAKVGEVSLEALQERIEMFFSESMNNLTNDVYMPSYGYLEQPDVIRRKSANVWFGYYSEALVDYSDFGKEMFTKTEREFLSRDASMIRSVSEVYSKAQERLLKGMQECELNGEFVREVQQNLEIACSGLGNQTVIETMSDKAKADDLFEMMMSL